MSEPSGNTKRHADLRIDETQDEKNGRAESWQGGPSNEEVRNDNNVRNINKRVTDEPLWGRSVARLTGIDMGEQLQTNPCGVEAACVRGPPSAHAVLRTNPRGVKATDP